MNITAKIHNRAGKSISKLSLSVASLVTLLSTPALAHPGHGVDQGRPESVLHYLGSPFHATAIVLGLAMVSYLAFRLIRLRRRTPAQETRAESSSGAD